MHIPPLRDRPEDIEPLIGHFLDRYAEPGAGLQAPAPTRPFLEALSRAQLPGNVRQLENVVRRAIVNRRAHQPLALSDLPSELLSELAQPTAVTQLVPVPVSTALAPMASSDRRALPPGPGWLDDEAAAGAGGWKLGRALDLCEQTMVAAALDASHGNRARAARLLGISPRSIFNKMRKHRLTA